MKTKKSPGPVGWTVPGRHTSILRHGEQVDAIRHLGSPANPVSVLAGRASQVKELVEIGKLDGRPLAYILAPLAPYIGVSGNGERRLADQVKAHPGHDEIFVVYFNDLSIGMETARYFEARYIQLADKIGTTLSNRPRPKIRDISVAESADHARLLHESLFLLHDAGCNVFQSRHSAKSKLALNKSIDAKVTFGSIQIPSDPQTFELKAHDGMWARGVAANERFYIMPGSEYWLAETKSLDRSYRFRRTELEQQQILAPIKGVTDRKRLLAWIDCGSAAIAAKILTGWRINSSVWKEVPSRPTVFVMKDFITGSGKRR